MLKDQDSGISSTENVTSGNSESGDAKPTKKKKTKSNPMTKMTDAQRVPIKPQINFKDFDNSSERFVPKIVKKVSESLIK